MVASHLKPPVRDEVLETALMDSPESLGYALCYLVSDLRHGFAIRACSGEIQVSAADADPFATALEQLLLRNIRRIQHDRHEMVKSGVMLFQADENPS